jgi:hypothetical protein
MAGETGAHLGKVRDIGMGIFMIAFIVALVFV